MAPMGTSQTGQNSPAYDPDNLTPGVPDSEVPDSAGTGADEPQFMTRADFEREWQARQQEMLRAIQSRTDQAEARIQRQVKARMDEYTRAAQLAVQGGFIPADKAEAYAQALRRDAVESALLPPAGQPAGGAAYSARQNGQVQQTPPDGDEPDTGAEDVGAINQQAQALYTRYGLAPDDPEVDAIITDHGGAAFLASIERAGRMKVRRVGQNPPGQPPPDDGAEHSAGDAQRLAAQRRLAARTPGAGQVAGRAAKRNPIADINDPDRLLDDEWNEVRQRFGGAGR